MTDRYISSPRPMWKSSEDEKSRSLVFGSKTSGVIVKITKKGLEFNAYYRGISADALYGVLREFALVEWDDLNQMKNAVLRGKVAKKKIEETPDKIEEDLDMEYIEKLPQVTMNGMKFYFDVERQERRPVDNPSQVFKFREVLGD